MKRLTPVVKEIGDNKFYIRPFSAFTAANMTGDLANVATPILAAIAPLVVKAVGSEDKKVLDQIAKLNGELTKQQQTDAGVEEYIWSDSGDGRVRESHHALNGKRFRWDDPPVVTPPGKPVRRCHPGQDYQCRCVALPVFDISTVDIPASGRTKGGG